MERFKLTYKNGEFVVVAPEGSYFIIGSLGGYPKRVEGGVKLHVLLRGR